MPEIICNTSPLQYLHQVGRLDLLPRLFSEVVVPTAVSAELAQGRRLGVDVPQLEVLPWVEMREPRSEVVLSLITDLGAGETATLALALERGDAVVILDDALARRHAQRLGVRFTGTLGLLLDAKRAGLIDAVTPVLDELQSLRFRLSAGTKEVIMQLAGET